MAAASIKRMPIIRDQKLIEGAAAIATALASPGGQIKLAKVARDHLAWFDLALGRGMSWEQIGQLLFGNGARHKNGTPFSVGVLSSAVWRAKRASLQNKGLNPAVDLAVSSSRTPRPRKNPGLPRDVGSTEYENDGAQDRYRRTKSDVHNPKAQPAPTENAKDSRLEISHDTARLRMTKAFRARHLLDL